MAAKFKSHTFWNFKTCILSFQIAFILCFFLGIFWNLEGNPHSIKTQVYNQNHRYYINRGLPIPWAGISASDKSVGFPIVKAPFITKTLSEDGSRWNKVINLKVFIPLFSFLFLISYITLFLFNKILGKNFKAFGIFTLAASILFLVSIFTYFFWFPRI